jgi:hypothetical protein
MDVSREDDTTAVEQRGYVHPKALVTVDSRKPGRGRFPGHEPCVAR